MENPVVLIPNEYCVPIIMEMTPPVIDNNNQPIDMEAGFSFDEDPNELLRGRTDLRSHLDDLAKRHPDIADQLRNFPEASSIRKDSTSSNPPGSQENQSQTDNQPATSNTAHTQTGEQTTEANTEPKIGNLQNHGLRNTVPLVESKPSVTNIKMNNENGHQDQRNSRAQSAPPNSNDNGQKFVSKIDINNAAANNENQAPQGQTQQQPQSNQNQQQFHQEPATKPLPVKQPNVRHIPIFVEGRDTPIVNRDHASNPIFEASREPLYEDPHHHMYNPQPDIEPPFRHFHQGDIEIPVQHVSGTGGYRNPNNHQQTQFGGSTFSKPKQNEKLHRGFNEQPHQESAARQHHQYQQNAQPQHFPNHPQGAPHHQQAPADQQHPKHHETSHAPSPPKKISKPKTPLELIQEIQGEVDKLKLQIENYKGTSRTDKEYMYLDEMLTRELLKLDNIDAMGNEEIRNLRRATIKNIQNTISSLENKVPVPSTPADNNEPVPEPVGEPSPEATAAQSETNAAQDAQKKEDQPMEVEPPQSAAAPTPAENAPAPPQPPVEEKQPEQKK